MAWRAARSSDSNDHPAEVTPENSPLSVPRLNPYCRKETSCQALVREPSSSSSTMKRPMKLMAIVIGWREHDARCHYPGQASPGFLEQNDITGHWLFAHAGPLTNIEALLRCSANACGQSWNSHFEGFQVNKKVFICNSPDWRFLSASFYRQSRCPTQVAREAAPAQPTGSQENAGFSEHSTQWPISHREDLARSLGRDARPQMGR
jgi:hypothetical protein